MISTMPHGGARPGAGRPKLNRPPRTVAKRIPIELADKIDSMEKLLHVIKEWETLVAFGTGPRWSQAKKMMAEIKNALD